MFSDLIQNKGTLIPTKEETQMPNVSVDPCLVLTSDPKPRLRWTAELHERFVDAITQLGGPEKATPKSIMRTMEVKGLTLYHLKSHLQKYRLGKQLGKESTEQPKDAPYLPESQGPSSSPPPAVLTPDVNEGHEVEDALRAQMEVQRKLHEQLEAQRQVERFVDAESRYLQSLLERACQMVAEDSTANAQGNGGQGLSELAIKALLNSPYDLLRSPSLQPLPVGRVGVHGPEWKPPNHSPLITNCFTQSSSTTQRSAARLSTEVFPTGFNKRLRSSEGETESRIWGMARTGPQEIDGGHTDPHEDFNFLDILESDEKIVLERH